MTESKQHETPEKIEAHLNLCLYFARRLCLHADEQFQVGGLRRLRELYRACRNGRLTSEQRKRYDGVLKVVRPHVRAMKSAGLKVPSVVDSELERVRDRGERPRA